MFLPEAKVQPIYYGLAGFIRERAIAQRPVPPEVVDAYRFVECALSVSRARHESDCDTDQDASSEQQARWLTTQQVAALLGWNERKVQRHVKNHPGALGAQLVAGRLHFRPDAVTTYLEETHRG